jgi:hypothetical protein
MDRNATQPKTFARHGVEEMIIHMTVFPQEMRKIPIHARRISSQEHDLWIGNGLEDIFVPKGITINLIPGLHMYITGKSDHPVSANLHFIH